jgi:hypothetical protein
MFSTTFDDKFHIVVGRYQLIEHNIILLQPPGKICIEFSISNMEDAVQIHHHLLLSFLL